MPSIFAPYAPSDFFAPISQDLAMGIFLWLLMGRGQGEDSRCQEEGRIFLPGSLQGFLPSSTTFPHASQAVVRQKTLSPEV